MALAQFVESKAVHGFLVSEYQVKCNACGAALKLIVPYAVSALRMEVPHYGCARAASPPAPPKTRVSVVAYHVAVSANQVGLRALNPACEGSNPSAATN